MTYKVLQCNKEVNNLNGNEILSHLETKQDNYKNKPLKHLKYEPPLS